MQNDLICPKCKKLLYFNLDEWGRTPWHLHCDFCHINIGTDNKQKAVELIQKYNKNNTYIEYYDNDIQVLFEKGKAKIIKENKLDYKKY